MAAIVLQYQNRIGIKLTIVFSRLLPLWSRHATLDENDTNTAHKFYAFAHWLDRWFADAGQRWITGPKGPSFARQVIDNTGFHMDAAMHSG
ncbi:hypothetical protein [Pseudorhodobacter sp.]|uniref:hypothetical protein n=1 Tax=Pseudorhodobacter sp. TaxID=1934400 RepID=UPI002648A193|nr:hypothetical protein [Pseudorhodobacter sp.]MDN5787137.1 hypothetical protein [Pseudorhodobacter sp.]